MGGKTSFRRPVFAWSAIVLSIVFILVSSVYVYALAGGYQHIYEDDYLEVKLRIDRITIKGDDTARIRASVMIFNGYEDDIKIHFLNVSAYACGMGGYGTFYGSDQVKGLLVRAGSVKVVRKQVVVEKFTSFLGTDSFMIIYRIEWTHFGHYYIESGGGCMDLSPWKDRWPELS